MLRESLESVSVCAFLQRNFGGCQHLLSLFANLPRLAKYLKSFTVHQPFSLSVLKIDFALHGRSIKLMSNVCGLSFGYLTNFVRERHIKTSSDFAARILADSDHPLLEEL